MNKEQNIEEIFQKYLENRCTPEESELLLEWLAAEEYGTEQQRVIRGLLTNHVATKSSDTDELKRKLNKNFENISRKIEEAEIEKNKVVKFMPWWRRAAAAVLFAAIASGAFLYLQKNPARQNTVADKTKMPLKNDLTPGRNKAILTLGDGSELLLEDAQNGSLAQQGNTNIIKKGEQLMYNQTGKADEVVYNTVTTPRGGQYQLVLADGSKIWLNAASSIRFPTTFQGKERKVEITGEAYFEVAKNAGKSFKVLFKTPSGKHGEVLVLGTHFNIMAYSDESTAKTTLLEGSVKISGNGKTAMLKPGQQASLKEETIAVLDNVNTEEAVAWKNGYFQFNAASLEEMMRQISRWYDVDVSYEGKIPVRRFGGKISRDNNASEVLKILELSKVKFRIEKNKLIVSQ